MPYENTNYPQYGQGAQTQTKWQQPKPEARQYQARDMQTPPLAGSMPSAQSGLYSNPQMPSGSFTGTVPGTGAPITPLASWMPAAPSGTETPPTVQSPYYTAGFLKNFIGRNIRAEFLMGTGGSLTDRVGTLLDVGASYIVIQPLLTDDLLVCDLYSIRFITIFG